MLSTYLFVFICYGSPSLVTAVATTVLPGVHIKRQTPQTELYNQQQKT